MLIISEHPVEQWWNIRIVSIIHINNIVCYWILRHCIQKFSPKQFYIFSSVKINCINVCVSFNIFLHFIRKISNIDIIQHYKYNESMTTFNSLQMALTEFLLTPTRVQIISETSDINLHQVSSMLKYVFFTIN